MRFGPPPFANLASVTRRLVTPASLGAMRWYDASSVTTVVDGPNTRITQFRCRVTGTIMSRTVGAGMQYPRLVASDASFNGAPTADFLSTGGACRMAEPPPFTAYADWCAQASGRTAILVYQPKAAEQTRVWIEAPAVEFAIQRASNTTQVVRIGGSPAITVNTVVPTNQPTATCYGLKNTSAGQPQAFSKTNNTTTTANETRQVPPTVAASGVAFSDSSGNAPNGTIAMAAVWARALTDGEITLMGKYIKAVYAVNLTW